MDKWSDGINSEGERGNFESNQRLAELDSKARANFMKKYADQERKTVEDNFWDFI